MFKKILAISIILKVILLIAVASTETASIIVRTQSGPVRGERLRTLYENKEYNSLKGIPYAQPIEKHQRFLSPTAVRPWIEPRNCDQFGNVCLQFNKTDAIIGSEDCLFLNVYAPADRRRRRLRPVMVFIHGGRFTHGSGTDDFYGPDFLLNSDVIVVTFNYRLNIFGFLSVGTPHVSGNQGMKDQELALKWIHQNIAAFGGDPDNVTIFGQSAGSAACELHRIASQGLFRQSIEMSGFFDVWSMFRTSSNVHTQDVPEFIAYLRTLDSRTLVESFPKALFERQTAGTIQGYWFPVVESLTADKPFLQSAPNDWNYTANINVLTGYTTAEALSFGAKRIEEHMMKNKDIRLQISSIPFNVSNVQQEYEILAKKIETFYFPNEERTTDGYVQMLSNIHENYPIDRKVKTLARKSNGRTFYYRFGLDSVLNYYKRLNGDKQEIGAAHGDDLCYLFYCKGISEVYANITTNSAEYVMIKRMTKMYSDFARKSDPGFPAVQVNNIQYLDITNEQSKVATDPLRDAMSFWHNLLNDHKDVLGL